MQQHDYGKQYTRYKRLYPYIFFHFCPSLEIPVPKAEFGNRGQVSLSLFRIDTILVDTKEQFFQHSGKTNHQPLWGYQLTNLSLLLYKFCIWPQGTGSSL